MAVTAFVYGLALKSAFNKEIDFDSDDMRAALVTSGYTPNQDTHQYWSSVVANEASGTGYTANGQALVSPSFTYTSGTNTLMLDCNDPAWTSSTVTARYIVFYDRTPGTDATRPLLCYWDLGADVSSVAGTFTATVAATGLVTVTAA
jgi:hypothetical protein